MYWNSWYPINTNHIIKINYLIRTDSQRNNRYFGQFIHWNVWIARFWRNKSQYRHLFLQLTHFLYVLLQISTIFGYSTPKLLQKQLFQPLQVNLGGFDSISLKKNSLGWTNVIQHHFDERWKVVQLTISFHENAPTRHRYLFSLKTKKTENKNNDKRN